MKGSEFAPQTRQVFLVIFTLLFLFNAGHANAQADGEAIFKSQCAQCHSVGENKVIGPGLKDIHTKKNEEWLIKWIKNSQALIKEGDAYAVKIYEENNKTAMPAFALSDDEVKAILAYIKDEGEKAPAPVAGSTGVAGGAEDASSGTPWLLWGVVATLFVLLLVLGKVKKALEALMRSREGLPEPEPVTVVRGTKDWIRSNKMLIAIIVIAGFVWSSIVEWDAMAGIGVSQDYAPEQPIKFSHKLHAGQNGISCVYCHSGALKSRHANIPSPNVCMNCHKFVQEGPVYGKDEIAKIYAALDYDPATQEYGHDPKPVQWIRVHNLPDLAYFNHSQHFMVGEIECQTCHGPVEEMDVVKQFAPLTMEWCIQCHIDTEVKMEGNEYYTDLHKRLKDKYGADAKLTVKDIGGMECARCHY
jgi:mono/diheme cytochrome c family protein